MRVYNGLRQSNGQLATILSTSSRTVERAISRLRKLGLIINKDGRKNHRCLIVTTDIEPVITDTMSGLIPTSGVATTDMTADHKERKNKEEEEVEKTSSAAFVHYWNSKTNLPHIRAFTSQRQGKFNGRMGEPLFAGNWREIVDKLSASSFATGSNQRNWKADIDWLLVNSNNYAKVLEGKYDNRLEEIKAVVNTPFTPQQEQAFLGKHTYQPTESEADELMKKMGLV